MTRWIYSGFREPRPGPRRTPLDWEGSVGRWQTDLFLALEIVECGLLALAAARAIGARSA
jgi:hypothetical protein